MARKIGAVIAGAAVAFALVMAIEALDHAVYPVPEGLDFEDPEALAGYVRTLPAGALLFVLAAWTLAAFGGGLVACWIARDKPAVFAWIVGGLILLGAVANLIMIPHPGWFAVAAVVLVMAAILAAARLGGGRGVSS